MLASQIARMARAIAYNVNMKDDDTMAKAAVKAAKAKKQVSIFDEVVAAIEEVDEDFKGKGKKETDNDFIRRLAESANDMPDDSFEALSEPAQGWLNGVLAQINDKKNKKPFTLPGGYPGADEEEEEEEVDEAPAPKAKGKGKAAPAPAPTKGKAKAAPVEEDEEDEDEDEKPAKGKKEAFGGKRAAPFTAKPDGVTYQTRLCIAKSKKFVDITPDEISGQLAKIGITAKKSSINTILGDMKSTVKALQQAGRLAK